METFFQTINANTIIIAIGAIFVAYTQYRQNATKVSTEVINAYKEQVSQFKDEVKNLTDKVNELTQQVGSQEGIIGEKQKQIDDYKAILQNRNPELEKILTAVLSFMEKLDRKMEDSQVELRKQSDALNIKQ